MCRNTNKNGCFKIKIIIENATSDLLGNGREVGQVPDELVSASSRSVGAYRPPA